MSFVESLKKFIVLKDLRNKILFTFLLLLLCRVLAHIPLPGVDLEALKQFFAQNQIFGLLNMFSGGTMSRFSIVLMGVGPYITASIVMQLLTMVIPALEALSKEGEQGYRKINQYTRYLTVPLAALQGYAMITFLQRQGALGEDILASRIIGIDLLIAIFVITGGTILLMWVGELISEAGIGNGISLIITLGIIAGIPAMVRNTIALVFGGGVIEWTKIFGLILFVIVAVLVTAFIVLINEAQRNIPVSYARRVLGMRSYGSIETYLPLRVNVGGVIPIIFAMSLMIFPGVISRFFESARSEWLANLARQISNLFNNNLFYGIFYFLLVIGFTFFYSQVIFNPTKVTENLQKQGGFIPGIRPGRETEEYLKNLTNRINLIGGIFLGLIAVLPFIMQAVTKIQTLAIGGTGILIVVSVILETMRQIKSQLLMRSYEY